MVRSMWVRSPAAWSLSSRSAPMAPPSTAASSSRPRSTTSSGIDSLRRRGSSLMLTRPGPAGRASVLVLRAPAGRAAADLGGRQLRAVAGADPAGPRPGELAAAGAAGLEGAADGRPDGPPQPGQLVGIEIDAAPAGVDPGPPQGLVGQQVAHPGQRLLVEQAGLDRGPAAPDQVPEPRQRHPHGVRAEPPAGRVEGHPAEAP